jgi:hypothetical protein
MSAEQIREYARSKNFHRHTLERWLGWDEAGGRALLRIACALKLGENHLRDLLDWLEEIALRDGTAPREVLLSSAIIEAETDPRLGRADKVKRIKETIRRLRFPRLTGLEDAIRERIAELKLQPEIRMSVPPGLEGGTLHVEFHTSGPADLKTLAGKLLEAAEKAPLEEIFRLLSGATPSERSETGT